ncbi:MAG: hypothetical protein AAFQ02_05410 [Bacteroidota bacterium]
MPTVVQKTIVPGHYTEVMSRFDIDLFEALKPPVGKMVVEEFTGSETGDRVVLRFESPIKARWVSDIIEHGSDERSAWFVDMGTTLPWPLTYWHHRHEVNRFSEEQSEIVDRMTFRVGLGALDVLLWPMVYLAFYPRKAAYRRYFSGEE